MTVVLATIGMNLKKRLNLYLISFRDNVIFVPLMIFFMAISNRRYWICKVRFQLFMANKTIGVAAIKRLICH